MRPALAAVLAFTLALPALAMKAAPPRPRLDVAFVLDTTGSMGDEIDVVKEKLVSIARRLNAGQPQPDVRFAVVAFRDRGDAYVTRRLPFDRDLKKVERFIRALDAGGGGDTPEDVAAALNEAARLDWDRGARVARVTFLVGDAGPQAYPGAPSWEQAVTNLREKKITVHTIGCSGLEGSAGKVFRTIAERTKGDFEHLTYRRVERLADGRRRTIIMAGEETFVAEGELSEAEWKKGAEKLAAEGRVARAARPMPRPGLGRAERAAPRLAGLGMAMEAPAAAAPVMMDEAGNNLDEEIASRLVEAAEKAGASYDE